MASQNRLSGLLDLACLATDLAAERFSRGVALSLVPSLLKSNLYAQSGAARQEAL